MRYITNAAVVIAHCSQQYSVSQQMYTVGNIQLRCYKHLVDYKRHTCSYILILIIDYHGI